MSRQSVGQNGKTKVGVEQPPIDSPSSQNSSFGEKALQAAIPAIINAHQAPSNKTTSKAKAHHDHHHPTPTKQREQETLEFILASGGSATGMLQKSGSPIGDRDNDGIIDLYEAQGYKTEDVLEDLKSRIESLKLGETASPIVGTDGDRIKSWEALSGDNRVGSAFRDKGGLSVLLGSRGVLSVMTGMSEALSQYLQSQVPANRFDPVSGQPDLFFLFELLRRRKKGALTEFEREAELMLGGSVAILSIPQIIENLIEMGINPMLARSLEGPLAKLIKECKKKDDDLHQLYLVIKEESELNVRPDEDVEEEEAA